MQNKMISNIKKRLSELTPKNISIIILCTLIIILPTIFAAIHISHVDTKGNSNIFSVTLYDIDGTQLAHESGVPEVSSHNSLIYIFYRISNEKKPYTSSATPTNFHTLKATINYQGTSYEIFCHLSLYDLTNNYYTDSQNNNYAISSSITKDFFSSSYSELFYKNAISPSLITIDNDIIVPSSVDWSYKNISNNFSKAQKIKTASEILTYEMTGELDIRFDTLPDYCTVQISDLNDSIIYQGLLKDLQLTLKSGDIMRVSVHARWDERIYSLSYGSADYDFYVKIKNRSEFSINTDSVSAGGFAMISCTNITDISKIVFTPNINIPTPIFHRDGEYVRALLYFPESIDTSEFDFNISYGISTHDFSINVIKPNSDVAPKYVPFNSNSASVIFSQNAVSNFYSILSSFSERRSDTPYFRGEFISPTNNGMTKEYSYKDRIVLYQKPLQPSIGTEFVSNGIIGEDVNAINNGIVCNVGFSSMLGYYAIVDHGCGIRTWYAYLSDTDLEIGDIVMKGQSIGKTGRSLLSNKNGFLLICSYYDTLVDPSLICGETFID